MNAPDLLALQRGDPAAWDTAFDWLWRIAFEVVQLKLQPFLPGDIEDVAIEVMEQLVEKVRQVKQVQELKPLTASIAHNRAVSRLREHFAAKRGSGKTESLEAIQIEENGNREPANSPSLLAGSEQGELADLLSQLLARLKPEQRAIMIDFYLHELSYEQISKKHRVPEGTIGVYLKRGLESIRGLIEGRPGLLKELGAYLRCLL
ncbi:MAG: RNA polymerase sigma factor [Verrucomicrobiota bacterium]